MAGLHAARRLGFVAMTAWLLGGMAGSAGAFEFLDGRLQVHGFFEEQIRGLGRDFDLSDDFDLAQWYHVLNVEIEYEVAPDGWGPFDLISTFVRLEGRYDCVWTRGCGMLRSVDSFGDRSQHLPRRLIDARRDGFTSTVDDIDRRPFAGIPAESGTDAAFFGAPAAPSLPDTSGTDLGPNFFPDGYLNKTQLSRVFAVEVAPNAPLDAQPLADFGHDRRPVQFFGIPGIQTLFGSRGADTFLGTGDEPAPFIFSPFEDCIFALRRTKGEKEGRSRQIMGPWNPGCKIRNLGALRNKPNPFNPLDVNPILRDTLGGDLIAGTPDDAIAFVGSTALPFKPPPENPIDPALDPDGMALQHESQGIFYPNQSVRRLMRQDGFGSFDQNFRQAELEWNRGASQQDEKELKEVYIDFELFDSRLWIRGGKQSIVWGKTELFRTTDQFNPQDVALATLPSLEESRIALWAVRGVWSFYEVGPLQDLRLELAFNYDQFEPADLGRCGEPFTPNPVCNKTFGLFAHGFAGLGAAGEIRPPDPWNSFKGIEPGARLEWRWGRFSFQLSDFYGYNDFPFSDKIFTYERNVDPESGRPRRAFARGTGNCSTGTEPDCLGVASSPASPSGNVFTDLDGDGFPDRNPDGTIIVPAAHAADVVENTPVNQQLYAMICATSIGFSPTLDPSVCAQSVLNSPNKVSGLFRVSKLVGAILGGSSIAQGAIATALTAGYTLPFVRLNADPNDDPAGIAVGNLAPAVGGVPFEITVSGLLTDQQEALLGCGPFYGSHCDDDGPDLLNAEASAIVQSWPGFDGTTGAWRMDGIDTDGDGVADLAQANPGTRFFEGGSPCLRFEAGVPRILPGCRGPFYNATTLSAQLGRPVEGLYDPNVDGCALDDGSPECAGAAALVIPAIDVDGDGSPDFGLNTGQQFWSEMAALSWNAMMAFVALSTIPNSVSNATGKPPGGTAPGSDDDADRPPLFDEFDTFNSPSGPGLAPGEAGFDKTTMGATRLNGCSYLFPQFCSNISSIFSVIGHQRNSVRAGGNGRFGRQDFVWQGGSPVALRYDRRNVLGFSADFAEDVTKSNWGAEFTWIEGLSFSDNNQFDGITEADTFNLTVSVDRPTFINFMNPNRTFFFNSQWFFQYVDGYTKGFTTNGPFNVLATFTVQTGYVQDRLLPSATWVYDMRSNSGGFLPQVTYRFTENFSASFGGTVFWGRWEPRDMALTPSSLTNRVGSGAYKEFVENGLSVVRDREELFLRIRYTF